MPQEISDYVAESAQGVVVSGFSQMINQGGARFGCERMAGFYEIHDLREWVLECGARQGMRFLSDELPKAVDKPYVIFALSMGFGNGSPLPQPSGKFEVYVNGNYCLSIRKVNHSQLWKCGDCMLAFSMRRCETAPPYCSMKLSSTIKDESQAAFGVGMLRVPASFAKGGERACIEIRPASDNSDSRRYFYLGVGASLFQANIEEALKMLKGERLTASGYNLYFGDIHTHSGQNKDWPGENGCGRKTWAENYDNARYSGGLDFYALTDHEYQFEPGFEREYFALADKYETPDEFVCLPAYEHTNLLYGHRNVYFRRGGLLVNNNRRPGGTPTIEPDDCVTPAELFGRLEESGLEFMTVPHHPSAASHPYTWDFFNPHDRLCEIYSVWGSSDYYGDFPRGVSDRHPHLYINEMLKQGLKFGIIASADGHEGYPGDESSPYPVHPHQFHFCGSGRAVVLAKSLTRDDVYDALYARRCYATTGTPIGLDFSIYGAVMGETVECGPPQLSIKIKGSNGLDHLRILKNGRVIHSEPLFGAHEYSLEWEDKKRKNYEPASYTIRVVQIDRESAWSSPIWVK